MGLPQQRGMGLPAGISKILWQMGQYTSPSLSALTTEISPSFSSIKILSVVAGEYIRHFADGHKGLGINGVNDAPHLIDLETHTEE